MRIDAKTIDELIERSREVCPDLAAVDELVSDTAPELERRLFAGPSITMIGYGAMPWVNKSGSGVWPLIGVAPQRQGISIYVAAQRNGVPLATFYADRLGKTNNGRNCIRFGRLADVDQSQLRQSVRDAIAWSAVQERMYGRACAVPVDET